MLYSVTVAVLLTIFAFCVILFYRKVYKAAENVDKWFEDHVEKLKEDENSEL